MAAASPNRAGIQNMMKEAAGEAPEASPDYTFKIVLIGDSACGKTNLLTRFSRNEFSADTRSTIGVEFMSKLIKVESGKHAQIQVWDTAGQDRYRAITAAYYRNASGAFLVYDISRAPTFKSLDKWLEDLRSHVDPEVPIIVVGNKSDLREHREVTQDQAKAWCEQNCINLYLETSALDSTNVETAFLMLINAMVHQIEADCDTTNDPAATQLPSDVHKLTKDDIVKDKGTTDNGNWCCGK
eukprot:TRINITY_DN11427_c0_g1_i1.p1 TRINITY_DN11427_c0_g1~~TRINITY_DN11427_c0_g1_i1.p1  ORF type:complete len:241 (-),score=52.21 TRINITY_DN11427_c0_g1_i1:523-1245(-)